MSEKAQVGRRKAGRKAKTSGTNFIIPMATKQVSGNECSSDSNRRKLDALAEKTDCKNVSFWIPPDLNLSLDGCIAEVSNALVKTVEAETLGTLKPVPEDPEFNL